MRATAELNTVILQFLARCVSTGDAAALIELGLQADDVSDIGRLHLNELHGVRNFPLLKPAALDRDVLRRLIEHLLSLRQRTALRDELLRRDAPQPLMARYYGMDSAEYAALGWQLRVRRPSGRPGEPTDDEQGRVWHAYESLAIDYDQLGPSDWLQLCEATGLSARVVYVALQRCDRPRSPVERSA